MKLKKLLSMALVCTMALACIPGCGEKKQADDGKIRISVAQWPEEGTKSYTAQMEMVAKFNEIYPDIEIVGDTYT